MIGRVAKGKLVPFGPLKPEVHVMLPGEADPTMHLDGFVRCPCVHIGQSRFCNRGGARRRLRAGVKSVGRIPHQRPSRFNVANHFCGHMFESLKGGDGAIELLADFSVLDCQVQGLLRSSQTVCCEGDTRHILKPSEQFPAFSLFPKKTAGLYIFEVNFVHTPGAIENV